jgi:RNA polymerase subunit RPABC4/transcription elongation factor Spt4
VQAVAMARVGVVVCHARVLVKVSQKKWFGIVLIVAPEKRTTYNSQKQFG